jgi:hypothetical protein
VIFAKEQRSKIPARTERYVRAGKIQDPNKEEERREKETKMAF